MYKTDKMTLISNWVMLIFLMSSYSSNIDITNKNTAAIGDIQIKKDIILILPRFFN